MYKISLKVHLAKKHKQGVTAYFVMKIVEHKNIPTGDEKARTKRSPDSIRINHFLFDPNTV